MGAFAAMLLASIAACGQEDQSMFAGRGGGQGGEGAGPGFGDDEAGPAVSGDVTPSSACVTSAADGALVPSFLVFMVDRSCSMSDDDKWPAAKSALDAFFADPKTQGLSASLDFFPRVEDSCAQSDYDAPTVAMQPLPAAAFATAIDASPLVCGTPTLPAIQGALAYAEKISGQHAGAKVAVVLVTDGVPDVCSSNVGNVASAAAGAAATHPTYVIGVGSALNELDTIAAGGGTKQAILINTATPAQITQDLSAALGKIKADAVSCEYTLPAPPAGQTLDVNRVNVAFTPSGGGPTPVAFDESCSGGVGWHYDDPKAPTKIVMCPSTCATLEGDAGVEVQILFGCQTSAKVR